MKKTAIALAMATVLGIAGTAMAANPFTDVPANHWSYASVAKLAQAGIVEGYGDGTFQGNNTMTRYEMAQIVAKAMARSDKADAAQKAMIEKLAAEYSTELNNLGVRVSALEKKTGTVKITGDARIRYRSNIDLAEYNSNNAGRDRWDQRARLNLSAQVNDNVTFTGRLNAASTNYDRNNSNASRNEDASSSGNLSYDLAYFTFNHAFGGKLEVGRYAEFIGATGLAMDVSAPGVDGARYTYGTKNFSFRVGQDDVSTNVTNAVNYKAATTTTADSIGNASLPITYVDASYKMNKLTVNGAYLNSNKNDYLPLEMYDFGASYKFDSNWKVAGDYLNNTQDEAKDANHKAYLVRANYKGADYAKEGSWGAWVDYRKAGEGAVRSELTTLNAQSNSFGAKGYGIGVNYTLTPNVVMAFMFEDLKSYDGTKNYSNFYRFETNFRF